MPAIRRENVEGVSVYNLLKYHQVIITELALTKLIKEINSFPQKMSALESSFGALRRLKELVSSPFEARKCHRDWHQRFATPDGKWVEPPKKVEGWNAAWIEPRTGELGRLGAC